MGISNRQKEMIEAMLAHPMVTNTAIAEMIGVHPDTIRRWLNKEEVYAELKKRLQEQWEDAERAAQETMISLVREGDFKASKYVLDSLGYAAPTKVEAEIKEGNINIIIDE